MTDWPAHLRDFRKRNKLTQAQLADYLQISKRNVENWEEGIRLPPVYLKMALDVIEKEFYTNAGYRVPSRLKDYSNRIHIKLKPEDIVK